MLKPSSIGISLTCGPTFASSPRAARTESAKRPSMLYAIARKCRLWL